MHNLRAEQCLPTCLYHALATRDPALGFSYLAIAVISLTSILLVLL